MKVQNFKYSKEFKIMNRILDDDYNKLSDKYKNLKLSHNRMKNLLKMTLDFIESGCPCDVLYLHKRITLELYGLENYKGMKGGKNEN